MKTRFYFASTEKLDTVPKGSNLFFELRTAQLHILAVIKQRKESGEQTLYTPYIYVLDDLSDKDIRCRMDYSTKPAPYPVIFLRRDFTVPKKSVYSKIEWYDLPREVIKITAPSGIEFVLGEMQNMPSDAQRKAVLMECLLRVGDSVPLHDVGNARKSAMIDQLLLSDVAVLLPSIGANGLFSTFKNTCELINKTVIH